jgi:hypothetical protein
MALIAGLVSSEMAGKEAGLTDTRERFIDCGAAEEEGLMVADHTLDDVHDWRRFGYNYQINTFPTKVTSILILLLQFFHMLNR